MRRKLAAGNWKMNGTRAALPQLEAIRAACRASGPEVLICPPATLVSAAASVATGTDLRIGGQDCHSAATGAHTGDVAAPMLADAGATYVIVGHSERREDHGETDAVVRAKAEAGIGAGLGAVICVGESLTQREAGETLTVVGAQLAGSVPDSATPATVVIAYEPVWAIGTGKVPTLDQIAEVHDFIRAELTTRFKAEVADGIRILYGGSVKPGNAAEIFATSNVDGALVGGASLKASDFVPIIEALAQA